MSVVIETTLGDITVDLYLKERPRACLNFLKLCKIKYYNYNLFHTISRNFIAQTGDPTGSRGGGESIFGVLEGPLKRYFEAETAPRIKHTVPGLVSFVGNEEGMIGSQFFVTLGPDLTYLDAQHCVFGEVVEGHDVLDLLNEVICDGDNRPYQDVRITHTVILDDPLPDPKALKIPLRSPSPSAERLQGGRIAPDEEIDETAGKSLEEINEMIAEREAKARATILEMVGDIPDVDVAPPENVLFVCKLNPVTTDDDLEIIFSRFGRIKSCEVIRDKKTGDSLQYAFVEFEDQKACEDAYFKMDNVLIDDRRIHVDFSQSVAKVKWHGKGRGVTHYDDKGKKTERGDKNIGKGSYKVAKKGEGERNDKHRHKSPHREDRGRGRDGQNREDNGEEQNRRRDRNASRSRSRERRSRRDDEKRKGRRDDDARNRSRSRERRYTGRSYNSDGRSRRWEESDNKFEGRNRRRESRSPQRDRRRERSEEKSSKSRKRDGSIKRGKKRESNLKSSENNEVNRKKLKSKTKTKDRGRKDESSDSSDSEDKKKKRRKSSDSSSDSSVDKKKKTSKKKKKQKRKRNSSSSD